MSSVPNNPESEKDQVARLPYPASFLAGLLEELEEVIDRWLASYGIAEEERKVIQTLTWLEVLIGYYRHPEEFPAGGRETFEREIRQFLEEVTWRLHETDNLARQRTSKHYDELLQAKKAGKI